MRPGGVRFDERVITLVTVARKSVELDISCRPRIFFNLQIYDAQILLTRSRKHLSFDHEILRMLQIFSFETTSMVMQKQSVSSVLLPVQTGHRCQ
jgi:hypothetical protein